MGKFTALHVLFAGLEVVCENKSRLSRKKRITTSVHEDLRTLLHTPGLSPDIIRLQPGGIDPNDTEWRRACEDARAFIDTIDPVVLALMGKQPEPHPPARRRA